MAGKGYKRWIFGIQRKLILAETLVLGYLFLTAYFLVVQYVKVDRYEILSQQYSYVNERLRLAFEKTCEDIDLLTSEFILNGYVQKALTNQNMTLSDIEMMEKELTFHNESFLDYYLVIDNKGNMYSQKKVDLNLRNFQNSYILKSLGEDYSDTKIIWARDVVFGSYEMSFFAVRYIHEMNSVHEPGVLILKLNDSILNEVRKSIQDGQLYYFILDENNDICFSEIAGGETYDPEDEKSRNLFWNEIMEQYANPEKMDWTKGILSSQQAANSQFTILTYAPVEVIHAVIRQMQVVLGVVFSIVYLLGMGGIILFTRRLTQPIAYVSNVMSSFDESQMEKRIRLSTNTELDQIGDAYNDMVERVGTLMADVKKKERDLRKSELESLMYQIRPHFLYNTLDTIYMLARISGEETIMKMIQSLSRFLRINLSNGKEEIPVEKELEHVSAYLDIQKIRNAELFTYQVEVEPSIASSMVMKMILQPIAENCIKYGFRNIYEGGFISIHAYEEAGWICFTVENNGEPIGEDALAYLNGLERMSMEEMDARIQNRQGGYGISNVIKRLRLQYPGGVRIHYLRKENGTKCTIQIKPDRRGEHQ